MAAFVYEGCKSRAVYESKNGKYRKQVTAKIYLLSFICLLLQLAKKDR